MFKSTMYDYDVVTIKKFGSHKLRIVESSCTPIPGFEKERAYVSKCSVNESKLADNITRAKTRLNELALCNPWDYWCTFTISPQKYDRYDLKTYVKDFAEFLHNYNRRCSPGEKVRYLFIPERHKDNSWHMHGFIKGIRKCDLFKNRNGYLDWKQYSEKFGYISLSPIRDIERTASYAYKYMTKDISKNVCDLGAHLYYCSKGLKSADVIYKGHGRLHAEWDYVHPDGYCKIKNIDTRKDDLECCFEVLP